MSNPNRKEQGSGQVLEETKTKKPRLFKVLIWNDDFTPMDFVVHVLVRYFQREQQEAAQIMLDVHKKGCGVAGVFTKEIAETKVMQVNKYSQMHEYPLKTTAEPE
jgi:ATP-dependent Clp protease adaptor protein ClpS